MAMHAIRGSGLLDGPIAVLDKYCPRPVPLFVYNNRAIVEQLIAAGITGHWNFQDASALAHDPVFTQSISGPSVASAPTVCRVFGRIDACCQNQRNEALSEIGKSLEDLEANKTAPERIATALTDAIGMSLLDNCLRILAKSPQPYIMIDVDGTPVRLFGKQQERAYDGHYGFTDYLPILVTINGLPAFVQNAPGAAYGAGLLDRIIDELLKRVRQAFPDKLVVVRGDTGYCNDALLSKIAAQSCRFIVGNNVQARRQEQALLEQVRQNYASIDGRKGIPEAVMQFFCPDPECFELQAEQSARSRAHAPAYKYRACGIVEGYRAKSWTVPRTVVYRLNYDPAFQNKNSGINLRFIQTNLTAEELEVLSAGRGLEKGRATPETSLESSREQAVYSIEMYESVFGDRGMDERLNCEWKSHCFASTCSCSGFFANSVRMLLSTLLMQAMCWMRMKLFPEHTKRKPTAHRRSLKTNTSRAHKAEKRHAGPTLQSIRTNLFCVPAVVSISSMRVHLSIAQMSSFWTQALHRLARIT